MGDKIVIYGKATCPFTNAAIDNCTKKGIKFDYIDIIVDPNQLDIMLKYSNGARKIPVIVDGGNITIGFEGKS